MLDTDDSVDVYSKKTSERPKEEFFRISDAPKNDYFWGLSEPQISKSLGDTL